jgi:hypothetical protein
MHENRGNRISEHFQGVGVISPEMIERRARELAIISGRDPESFTDADWEQARRELNDPQSGRTGNPAEEILGEIKEWDDVPGSTGEKTPTHGPEEEPQISQQLVDEGVEEATHDQLLEAHKEDLRREKKEEF